MGVVNALNRGTTPLFMRFRAHQHLSAAILHPIYESMT